MMKTINKSLRQQQLVSILLLSTLPSFASARYGYHGGGGGGGGWAGGGGGGGQGMGMGQPPASATTVDGSGGGSGIQSRREMMQLIHQLIDSHDDVTRYYNETDDGIESYTFSDDPTVAAWIQEHVHQMAGLMSSYPDHGGIRMRDPLFKAAFDFSSFHEITVSNTDDGVRVVQSVGGDVEDETTKACTISIIKEHAAVVSKFVANGRSEMRKNHEVPSICKSDRRVAGEARISDPTVGMKAAQAQAEAQKTNVVSALETVSASTANAATKSVRLGHMATILACVLFVSKSLL